MSEVRFATCPLCEAMCGISVKVEAGRATEVRGDDADPFSKGHICPKATALVELQNDPDRLRQPLIRQNGQFHEASWDEALEAAAAGIHRVQKEHGNRAMAAYLGNPVVHNLGAMLFAPNFIRALKTPHRYSATSVDQLPHQFVSYFMFGHQLLFPVADLDRTDFLLILGGNPLASNGSLMTAPDMKSRLKGIRSRGGRVVLIDPRRTETAAVVDAHHFIRPGTDAALLLALVHVIEKENLVRPSRALDLADGRDKLRAAAQGWTPERAAAVTGIDAGTITTLARDLARAERGVVYGRMGVSTQAFGALCQWLIVSLNILTGHFDVPGGSLFTAPALDAIKAPGPFGLPAGSHGRWASRVRGAKEFGGELPIAVLAEEILTPGKGAVHGLVTVAGNPVLSTPNGRQLDQALAALDFYVAIDPYLNETTRHAHVILPPVGPLERDQFDAAFHLLSVRNTAKYSPAVLAKPAGAKHDWEILLGLESRLAALHAGGKMTIADRLKFAALRKLGPRGLIDLGLRAGPYGLRRGLRKGLTVKKLIAQPHGIDLGPLASSLPGRLPKGRINLAPGLLVDDVARLAAGFPLNPEFPLLLIGRRGLRDCNSWLHNVPSLMTGKARCTLYINPADAAKLGVAPGAGVRIRSRVGEVIAVAEVTDAMMPGVVSLPHGYGHDRPGTQMATAAKFAGVSINDLTDDQSLDALSGNAALNGLPVRVTPA